LDLLNPSSEVDRQTFFIIFINLGEHPDLAAIGVSNKDKVTKGNLCGT
jgi:hypothetical protein